MIKIFWLLFTAFLLGSCKKKNDATYSMFPEYKSNSTVMFFLKKNDCTIDSSLMQTNYNTVAGRNVYEYFHADIGQNNWSCDLIDSIKKYQYTYLKDYFKHKIKFLNRIIQEEDIKYCEIRKITDRLQELMPFYDLSFSTDSSWRENVELFYNNFVFNKTSKYNKGYKLDTCEVSMYKSMYNTILLDEKNVIYITPWNPDYLNEGSVRKYIFEIWRMEILSTNQVPSIDINFGEYIKFR